VFRLCVPQISNNLASLSANWSQECAASQQ
jgi:hypothetical protein